MIELVLEDQKGTVSRSAMELGHRCQRARFLGYEVWRGWSLALPSGEEIPAHCGGLSPERPSAALLTGGAIHEGVASLFKAAQRLEAMGVLPPWGELRRSPLWEAQIDVAAAVALCFFERESQGRGISFGLDPVAAEFYAAEQRALVEGLVWVAGLRLIPELISRYAVVEVEREERMELGPGLRPFAARADALLRERDSGDLSVFSLKTGALYGRREEQKFKRDVQGLSEAVAIERRLLQSAILDSPRSTFPANGSHVIDLPKKVATVQMALLLKGLRKAQPEAKGTGGRKEHYSPLTRAYRLRDALSGLEQWAWSYDTPKTAKDGSSYMGKLGKDWETAPTWERAGGIRAWVLALDRGEIQGECGDPLAQCFAAPEPWSRSEQELEDWLEQAAAQEAEVQARAEGVNAALGAGDLPLARKLLNRHFPQNRQQCVQFGGMCSFDGLCWGGGEGLVQLAAGLPPEGLTVRKDHHGEEGVEEE